MTRLMVRYRASIAIAAGMVVAESAVLLTRIIG